MWEAGEFAEGERREGELVGKWDWFGDMLSQGAQVMRVAERGTGVEEQKDSALSIISYLLSRLETNPTVELDIQRELVLEKKSLNDTSAGQEALGGVYHLRRQLERQLEGARREMEEAVSRRDEDAAKQIRMVEEECEGKIGEAKREQEELRMSLTEMHEEQMERVLRGLDETEKQQEAVLEKKRRELEDMEESVRLMREQSQIDSERWERQRLDVAAMQKKRRVMEELERESAQNVVVARRELAREEAQMQSIGKVRGVMRKNLANGMVNGAASAIMTTVGAAGKITIQRLVVPHPKKKKKNHQLIRRSAGRRHVCRFLIPCYLRWLPKGLFAIRNREILNRSAMLPKIPTSFDTGLVPSPTRCRHHRQPQNSRLSD